MFWKGSFTWFMGSHSPDAGLSYNPRPAGQLLISKNVTNINISVKKAKERESKN